MKIAIIDLDSVCYSIGNGNKVMENGVPVRVDNKFVYVDKTEEELRSSADFYMKQILAGGQFTHYLGFMKGEDTTVTRKAANPEYKANRSNTAPPWWGFVCNDLFLRWQAKYVNNMEVDDMVNITRLKLPDSHIVAIDGDLLGLEGHHYNWRTSQWIEVIKHEADLNFWTDMISGQVGDNVKGLKGRGPAFAKKLFQAWYNHKVNTFAELVLGAYLEDLGEYEGIKQFYANYISLKILEDYPVTIPEPIPVPAV